MDWDHLPDQWKKAEKNNDIRGLIDKITIFVLHIILFQSREQL